MTDFRDATEPAPSEDSPVTERLVVDFIGDYGGGPFTLTTLARELLLPGENEKEVTRVIRQVAGEAVEAGLLSSCGVDAWQLAGRTGG